MVMTPSHAHRHWALLSSAGIEPICTLVAPLIHGAGVTGVHVSGVGMPPASAVFLMTSGLVGARHMPKEGMLTIGT